jgi:hypothetical protein
MHPVDEIHKMPDGSGVQGSETPNFNYIYPKNKYKQGR